MSVLRFIKPCLAGMAVGTMMLSFQNCSNNYDVGATGGATQASAAAVGTDTPPLNPAATVCNPFGGASATTSQGHGLAASGIRYLEPSQSSTPVTNFASLVNDALGFADVSLILSDVNIPNVYFSEGFQTQSGQLLQASDGSTLTAFFGFTAKGDLTLGDWAPGDYQIAVLTDDGSTLNIAGGVQNADGTTSDFTISNDGAHSMQMGCSSQVVHLDGNSELPLTFNYYQGPPVTIGLMIIARPVPAGNVQDVQCGKGGTSDQYFFNDSNYPNPSVAQQPYKDLVSRGWAPIDSSHYLLPTAAASTTCSSPAGI